MLASMLPPAPIEVMRPGWSSGFTGSIANSVSTIRDRGWTCFQPAGAASDNSPFATVNSAPVSANTTCTGMIKSAARDNVLNPKRSWDGNEHVVRLGCTFMRMPWVLVLIINFAYRASGSTAFEALSPLSRSFTIRFNRRVFSRRLKPNICSVFVRTIRRQPFDDEPKH